MKRRTKNKVYIIGLFSFIAFTIYFGFKLSNDLAIQEIINERNALCANLTFQLAELDKDCLCHFEGFKTDTPDLDKITSPLCVCECIINGSPMRIGLLSHDKPFGY